MTCDDFPLPTAALAAVLGCTDSQLRTARSKAALVEGEHFIRQPIAGFQGGAHRLAFTIPGCIAIAQVLGTTHALEFADRCQQLLDGSGAIVPLDRGQLSPIPRADFGHLSKYLDPMAEAAFIDASPQSNPPRMADLTSTTPLQPTRSQAVLSLTRDGLSVASHDTNLVLNISRDTFADAPLEQPKQDANRPIEHIHYHGGSGAPESVLGLVAIVLVAILGLITLSWIADSLNRSPQVEVSRNV